MPKTCSLCFFSDQVGNQAMLISNLSSGLIWIVMLSAIPVSWGQQAPFYDTVQFEHAPSVNNKIGPLFCKKQELTNELLHVIRDNSSDALVGGPHN